MNPDDAAAPAMAPTDRHDSRTRFARWTDQLLDVAATPDKYREAAVAWCDWALATLGIDESRTLLDPRDHFSAATWLPTGKALAPIAAARCVREHYRTAVFLQAMEAAIREARRRFPGETIHVLEAGCGPLAPLVLPFALRYRPEEVSFTVLDLHEVSIASVRRLAAELGVSDSIRAWLVADATQVKFTAAERPHIMACEILLRALTREPQVAVTMNLAPQLRPGGLFLPERITIAAGLLDYAKRDRLLRGEEKAGSAVVELGEVFCLEAARLDALRWLDPQRLAAAEVQVPPHGPRTPFRLFTRIQVFREHGLRDFDSSLNLPERVRHPPRLVEQGGRAGFVYEMSADPGLRYVEVASVPQAWRLRSQACVDQPGSRSRL